MLLSVARVAALNEMRGLLALESARGVGELKGPQEVVGLLEVGAHLPD
jgi:hypothetical protein